MNKKINNDVNVVINDNEIDSDTTISKCSNESNENKDDVLDLVTQNILHNTQHIETIANVNSSNSEDYIARKNQSCIDAMVFIRQFFQVFRFYGYAAMKDQSGPFSENNFIKNLQTLKTHPVFKQTYFLPIENFVYSIFSSKNFKDDLNKQARLFDSIHAELIELQNLDILKINEGTEYQNKISNIIKVKDDRPLSNGSYCLSLQSTNEVEYREWLLEEFLYLSKVLFNAEEWLHIGNLLRNIIFLIINDQKSISIDTLINISIGCSPCTPLKPISQSILKRTFDTFAEDFDNYNNIKKIEDKKEQEKQERDFFIKIANKVLQNQDKPGGSLNFKLDSKSLNDIFNIVNRREPIVEEWLPTVLLGFSRQYEIQPDYIFSN